MTQPEEKEWLPMENDYLITYRAGDCYKAEKYTASHIAHAMNKFVIDHETSEPIQSIVKIS